MVKNKSDKPAVSVIITTRNEEKNIASCLESILNQTFSQEKIEIIVVDNYSTDKTIPIIQKFKKKSNIILYSFQPERSAQRNFGARKATGIYYLYVDADMTLSPLVIEESVRKMESQPIIALYIPEIITGESFWSQVRRFERSFYNATVIDCARFMKLATFLEVEGFDESMSGPEDWDLDKKLRLKGTIDIIPSPLYHNEKEFNIKKYLSKKEYYSRSFDRYIKKWGKDDKDIKKQLGFFYRLIGVFIEDNKWLQLIKSPHLVLGMIFLRILVGWKFVTRKRTKLKKNSIY